MPNCIHNNNCEFQKHRKNREPTPPPLCTDTRPCFARDDGLCMVLNSSDFKGKPCPFCKSKEQREFDLASSRARLEAIGRDDLLNYTKYKQEQEKENNQT